MSITFQNYRSSVSGEKPPSLLKGQIGFNLPNNFMYLGKGLNQNLDVNGSPVLPNPPTGEGWQEYNMDIGSPGNVISVQGGQGILVNGSTTTPAVGAVQVSIDLASPQFAGGVYGYTAPGDVGTYTAAYGAGAGNSLTTGQNNILIGRNAGTAYTTQSNNIIIGSSTPGSVTDSGFIRINNNGSTAALTINGSGACSISGSGFGNAGQVLASGGNATTPTWIYLPNAVYTSTKSLENEVPLALLSWSGTDVRMGNLTVSVNGGGTNLAWANITISSNGGAGSSAVTSSGGPLGTFVVTTNPGSGETYVVITPTTTISASIKYNYDAAFGSQPVLL